MSALQVKDNKSEVGFLRKEILTITS